MNQARKRMQSIRQSLDNKHYNTINATVANSTTGGGVLSKNSKISHSAIEILRNNPLTISHKNPISSLLKTSMNLPPIAPSKTS